MPELDSIRNTSEQGKTTILPGTTHLEIIGGVERKVEDIVSGKSITDTINSFQFSRVRDILHKKSIGSLRGILLKIKKSYQQKKADYYIKQGRPQEIVYRMSEFTLLDPKIYHPKIVDAVIKRGKEYMLVDYLEKLTGIDTEIYHPKIMESLIPKVDRYGSPFWVVDNLEKFDRFSPDIADILIESYKGGLLGKSLEKFIELDYSKTINSLIRQRNNQIDSFIINSPESCRKDIADALIKNNQQGYIRIYFKEFSMLDPYIYHPLLFDYLLSKGEIFILTEMSDKLTGLDTIRKEKLSELKDIEYKTHRTPNEIANHLDTYTTLTPAELVHTIMRGNGGRFIVDNLEKFTQILDQTSIAELLMKKNWQGYVNIKILVENLERFTQIDPNIYHPKIINTFLGNDLDSTYIVNKLDKFTGMNHPSIANLLISKGKIGIVLDNLERFTKIDPKFKNFLMKVQSRKSDIKILERYGDLKSLRGFDNIFAFYIENKQKSLIPLMQKLLVAKDIGIQTNFTSISNLIDTSWIKNTDPKEVKMRLVNIFTKLAKLTETTAGKSEFDNFLKHIKIFDDTTLYQLKQKFANIIEAYFNTIYDRKVKQRFVSELGLTNINNLDEVLSKPEIIEGFKMYQATTINKDQFKQILQYAVNNPNSIFDIGLLEKNQKWLNGPSIKDKNMKIWQERNEQRYDIGESTGQVDKTKDIEHFVTIANKKLELLGLKVQKDAGSLINYYNTEVKKKMETIRKESNLSVEEFETLYNDLTLQIQSLNDLFKESKAKTITSITIYKETDPTKVLMMGNAVDGSCLSFYSTVGNYWSTATNALDINKGVFFIEDQNGNIIGRVLTAIDNEGKIMRFRTYIKGNIDINLNRYFNIYIKELSEKIGLELNGNIRKVDLLNGKKWYEDPVEAIPGDE
ncbi:hypothetical protein KBD33_05125 [Candidatus Gracilibacteria bacterium]|nr:hypothetical protein [Candidatus Gracilibacteria bacterium]